MIKLLAKLVSFVSKTLGLGAGVTWAGEIALKFDPNILSKLIPTGSRVILIAGTNGKTTTSKMITQILGNAVSNDTGANILNGIVGTLITKPAAKNIVLETDEATLPAVVAQITPDTVVLLNLFRDQLDRYGEVDTIAKKWLSALEKLSCRFVINADDPQLAWLGSKLKKVSFFGLDDKKYFLPKMQHATDSIFCPACGTRLKYAGVYFSHLGQYRCPKCSFKQPKLDLAARDVKSPLPGVYNLYNMLAAAAVTGTNEITAFSPAFGRMEKIGNARLLLSKNPAGFNESLRTVLDAKERGPVLLVLNDRIPDGRDVSWIWDVDFENLTNYRECITCSGDRVYDLALRLKYAGISNMRIVPNLGDAVKNQSWILATYSAMLEVRKILTGKKIN
ncbi:MAG: MurT ligase domain-containing protein [Patescibacteria group bacterium]|nr:MurT ligase domain-containing protein [Patescibacteria group bacterium]MCL5432326.1 MurT ligase domain-containing protein [Patescibacteria group bacterium]